MKSNPISALVRFVTPGRAFFFLLAFLIAALPCTASAAEGKVALHFTSGDKVFLWVAFFLGLISIGIGVWLRMSLLKLSPGSAKMQSVGLAIRQGALAYLSQQIKTMIWFVVLLAIGLFFLFFKTYGVPVAIEVSACFVFGVTASYAAGYSGMLMAVDGNMRTANAALTSYKKSLEAAFRSGSVTGLMTVGLGLLGASIIFLAAGADAMKLLVGFGFGSSLAALFMRVGGGIFTKAADVGADLVGKVEAGIPEDDPRNPATIADNVGDNVGDCAGMAADVFESYSVTLIAAIVLSAATSVLFDQQTWMRLVIFSLMVCGLGLIGSIIGIFTVKGSDDLDSDPLKLIRKGFYSATAFSIVSVGILSFFLMGGKGVGTGISTSILIPVEQIQRDNYVKIRAARDQIARSQGKQPYELSATDIQADPLIKKLGLSDEEATSAIQQALAYRPEVPEESRPIPDLAGFQKLDFSQKDNPALGYAVRVPAENVQQNAPPVVGSLAEQFGTTDKDGKPIQKPLAIYDLEISQSPINPTDKPLDRKVLVGPVVSKMFDDQITKVLATGKVKVKINRMIPVWIYYNPSSGRLAIAGDGGFEVEHLQRQPFAYFTSTASQVQQAIGSQAGAPQDKLPPEYQAPLATIQHANVPWYLFFLPVVFGILLAFGIEQLTDYYVSTHRRPTQEVAGVSSAGAAPMIIQGFSYALESSVFMVLLIVIALMLPLWIFPPAAYNGNYILSFYGIALVGLGLLTTTGFVLAMDTFGPISDNAQGVYEMSGDGEDNEYGNKAVQRLDAAGNTTKALTKGFAIATAVIAAVALFHSFLEDAQLGSLGLRLDYPEIFLGLLIGGAAPFLFSAFSINAVGRAAFQLINEVRRQFRNDPGIMKGTSTPNYAACVSIVTAAAQKELLAPGILAIALPVAVGFGFSIGKPATLLNGSYYNLGGVEALGGFLAGAILSGQLMAVLLANAGGIWDNAKKIIEDGLYGGKGTEAHKASVVCDTVGDPFKDTAGPALNPLIKVMNLVALLMAPTFILPIGNISLSIITILCVLALAISLMIAKKGSLSKDLNEAQGEAHKLEDGPTPPEPPKAKRRITVEE